MRPSLLMLVVGIAAGQAGHAATLIVKNTNDSGPGSLRHALTVANSNLQPDLVTFDGSLSGKTITPKSVLPSLMEGGTHIDGDLNNDGHPDIALDGISAGSADGLYAYGTATSTVVEGLAIIRFTGAGVYFDHATDGVIESCHVGVSLDGTRNRPNGYAQVELKVADGARVGRPGKPNVISAGEAPGGDTGVYVEDTQNAVIGPDYVGINQAGTAALGTGVNGIYLTPIGLTCQHNTVRNCVVAGVYVGVWLENADANRVYGCTFGLAANGRTVIGSGSTCVLLRNGASGNVIGGTTAAERNVFAGTGSIGVDAYGAGTHGNRIEGNYFGTNAAGTAQRDLSLGVEVRLGGGPQIIGGTTAARGNYFGAPSATGVYVTGAGANSTIQNNRFGVLPAGGAAAGSGTGTEVDSVSASILDNTFAGMNRGVYASGAGATAGIYRNTFRACTYGVLIQNGAKPNLGNLSNGSTADDGGNIFQNSASYHIANEIPNGIKAEGNDFGTTIKAKIDAKIEDKLDNAAYGRVDFVPLAGGVIPTGGPTVATLALTGAAALSTASGAEILYTLSAPATVTIEMLNLAGRSVAVPARDVPTGAGPQRLAWDGRSGAGVPAPAGRYMAHITARDGTGHQASVLTPLTLRR
jgi:hypothetical protein